MQFAYRGYMYESVEIPEVIEVDGRSRPTRNNKGGFIHSTIEGIVAFWKWFGSSITVDENGKPKVFFHGSYKDFEEFQMPWDREDDEEYEMYGDEGYPGGNLGIGFYFTTTKQYAERFGRVKEYYVKITNLLDFTDERNVEALNARFQEERDELDYGSIGEVIDSMIKEGRYDGVHGIDAGGLSYGADEWMILKGNQAKLVANRGTFDNSGNATSE